MPIYKTITPNDNTAVFVWKIEESLDRLMAGVDIRESSRERLEGMRSELHQRGFLSVRHLLQHAGYNDRDLFYNEHGKPFLKDGTHISITHSFEFSAILLSNRDAGIDIEKNREKIINIQHRFVNTDYDSLSDEDLIRQLTVIWGAKESMYKTYPYGGLSFHDHIAIDPFLFRDGGSSGRVVYGNWKMEYDIFFHFLQEGFTLVYALARN